MGNHAGFARTLLSTVLLFSLGLLLGPPVIAQTWDLATDFRTAPDQANPNPDRHGNPAVWHFFESEDFDHDPGTYTLLPDFITDAFLIEGLQQWQGTFFGGPNNSLPAIGINATGSFVQVDANLAWPPGVIRVHPSPEKLVVVGWRSPIAGTVRIHGFATDMDHGGGNGATWFVEEGTSLLATGSFRNGGGQGFEIPDVEVNPGTFLYFIVDPVGNYLFDSTALRVTIVASELEVPIDVKPGVFPNIIDRDVEPTIPVAIVSTDDFDATTVDQRTVIFGPRNDHPIEGFYRIVDVNGDGRLDLVLRFLVGRSGLTSVSVDARLTATTTDGTTIEGRDWVLVRRSSFDGWDLATDFRIAPDQANPNPDRHGNPEVWHFLESETEEHDPVTYTLLPDFITNAFLIEGLQQWHGTESGSLNNFVPNVGVNSTDSVIIIDVGPLFPWAPGIIRVHPARERPAIVGWKSPINGIVKIRGTAHDMDAGCGDGAGWSVEKGTAVLATGIYAKGGAHSYQIPLVEVSVEDLLYFIVDRKQSWSCDNTAFNVNIRPLLIR